ncbi:TPA: DUF2737 family protein [Escherichia coli]
MRGLAYNPGILPAEMIIRQRVKPMPSREELLKRNSFPSVNQNKYLNANSRGFLLSELATASFVLWR